MLTNYDDIIKNAGEPSWYDEYGVPRYCPFAPKECGVYINAVTLFIIECQDCRERFNVATVWNNTFPFMEQLRLAQERGESTWSIGWEKEPPLKHAPSYGDPPRHDCSGGAGEVMSSNTVSVIELWVQENFDWVRKEEIKTEWNKQLHGLERKEKTWQQ